ncbi:MAG: tetratricopeptide repeat protein [Acidobacteriaceae bacterium]|nr:tetratricopeptide repeat protein [Acidobacteriaceae bacterium]
MNSVRNQVFISYSHKDGKWLKELQTHLAPLSRKRKVDVWADTAIAPGASWREEIRLAIANAKVAVLLVTANFLKSDFINNNELSPLLTAAKTEGLRVLWVAVSPCMWSETELAGYQAVNDAARPISKLSVSARQELWVTVAKAISDAVNDGPEPGADQSPGATALGPRSRAVFDEAAIASGAAATGGMSFWKGVSSPLPPRQLPPPPAEFTGRANEISEILAEIDRNGSNKLAIVGMGGVGKTALARKVAEAIAERYPDAHIHLDLKGAGSDPLSVAAVMKYVIRSLDARQEPAQDESLIAGTFRTLLSGRRVLLFFDNAIGSETLEALTPPKSCFMLVTSRQRLAVQGLVVKSIGALSPEDARDLLSRISGRGGPEIEKLAGLAYNLPIALSLIGAALRSEDLDLDFYVERLSNVAEIGELVQHSIRTSYDRLNAEHKRFLRMLCVFPSSFDYGGVGAIWEVDGRRCRDALGVLRSFSLVEWDSRTSRYSLHDLIRFFAGGELVEEDAAALRRRHARYYTDLAEKIEPLLTSSRREPERWLERLDAEQDNLRAAFHYSVGDTEQSELALRLAGALFWYWNFRGLFAKGISWLKLTLDIEPVHRTPSLRARARVLYAFGGLKFLLGDYDEAGKYLEESVDIWQEVGEKRGQGYASIILGMVALEENALQPALALQRSSVDLLRGIDDWGCALALNDLGRVVERIEGYEAACELFAQSLEVWDRLGDNWGRPLTLNTWGVAALRAQQYDSALDHLSAALATQTAMHDRWGIAASLMDLGQVFTALGRYPEAMDHFRRSVALHRELGRKRLLGHCMVKIVALAAKVGDAKAAATLQGALMSAAAQLGMWATPHDDPPMEGNPEFEAGRQMSLDKAVEYAIDWCSANSSSATKR